VQTTICICDSQAQLSH